MEAPLPSSVLIATNRYNNPSSQVAAIRARDGATQWVYNPNPSNPLSPSGQLTAANGVLYFLSNDPHLNAVQTSGERTYSNNYSLNAVRFSDGRSLWKTLLKTISNNSHQIYWLGQAPVVTKDMVFVDIFTSRDDPQQKDEIYALSTHNGKILRKIPLSVGENYSPLSTEAADDGFFYLLDPESTKHVGDTDIRSYLMKNQAETGSIGGQKFIEIDNSLYQSLYITQNNLYLISRYPRPTVDITSFKKDTGRLLWHRELHTRSEWSVAPVQLSQFGTHLYLHAGPILFALNAMNGATRWQLNIGDSYGANTIETENIVFAPGFGDNGRSALYALYAQDGSQIWQCNNFGFGAGFTTLAFYQNVLLVASETVDPHYLDLTPNNSEPSNALFALSAKNGSVYWRNTYVHRNLVFSFEES